MDPIERPWFSVGPSDGFTLRCAACSNDFDTGGPAADHHPRRCPACGVECALLQWKDRVVQILPAAAPGRLGDVVAWLQANLDELEYVSLLCALEEVADAAIVEPAAGHVRS